MRDRFIWNRMVFAPADPAESGGGDSGGSGAGPAGAAGAGGGGTNQPPPAFAESLPEDIRGEAVFKDIKDLPTLAKNYVHAQRLIGADPTAVLRLPGAEDAAGWDGVYAKLGRPEKADGYQFAAPTLPEGMSVDDGLKTNFAEVAHKAGLSAKQASTLYDWWNTEQASRYTAGATEQAQQTQQAETALRQEWGVAFDSNLQAARDAVSHYGGDKLIAELTSRGLANSPELTKVFSQIGKGLREDGLIGRGQGGGDAKSPGEALQAINALKGDAQFVKAYATKTDPGHNDAVQRMKALYEQAYPTQAA